VLWCTRDDVTNRLGTDAGRTGLTTEDLDTYAAIASEVLYVISGRQFPGSRDRTVRVIVGKARNRGAVASLGAWWPVTAVADVTGVNVNGTTDAIDPADWSLAGAALTVPNRWANLKIQALLTCGQDPTPAGRNAATALAAELLIASPQYDGEEDTRLPALVTSVSRQGVSQSFATVLDVVKEGATGVAEVDQFVSAYNNIKSRSRPRVRAMK
jgi:hypothetical protein